MTQSASVKARYTQGALGWMYGGAATLVGDGQIEIVLDTQDGNSGYATVLETGEVKDLITLLTAARRTAVQQMIDTHAWITGHTHGWAAVEPCCAGGGATCDH